MDISEALKYIRQLRYVDMEHKDVEQWRREWRKRTAEQILKDGVVWGCRDVALVLKHLLGERARIVEGVRILRSGGHVWVKCGEKTYDGGGEFHPILNEHGPYVELLEWDGEKDPFKDYSDWKKRALPVKLSVEAAAVAYAAFGNHWIFYHTERVVAWARKLEKAHPYEATIAAWLHDIGRLVSDEEHAKVGAEWAKMWLKNKGLEEESIALVVDGIANHGSSTRPSTSVGHTLKLSDALSIWDPSFVVRLLQEGFEKEKLRKMLEKKWRVIEKYGAERHINKEDVLKLLEE